MRFILVIRDGLYAARDELNSNTSTSSLPMKNASIWSVVSLCNDAICAILYRSSKLPTTGSTLPRTFPRIWICFNQLGAISSLSPPLGFATRPNASVIPPSETSRSFHRRHRLSRRRSASNCDRSSTPNATTFGAYLASLARVDASCVRAPPLAAYFRERTPVVSQTRSSSHRGVHTRVIPSSRRRPRVTFGSSSVIAQPLRATLSSALARTRARKTHRNPGYERARGFYRARGACARSSARGSVNARETTRAVV